MAQTRPACSASRAATSRTSARRWPSPARRQVIDAMLAKYLAYGNRYTLFAAAFTQFPF